MAPFAPVFFDFRFLTFTDFFAALRALGFDFLALLICRPHYSLVAGIPGGLTAPATTRLLVMRNTRAFVRLFDERFFSFTDFFFFRFAEALRFAGAFFVRLALAFFAGPVDFAMAAPSCP
jgi:hypothetical protein